MSDTHHDAHGTGPAHDTGHDAGHGEHGHADTLGEVDWIMWGVGALGVILALVVVAGLVMATQGNFA